MEKVVLYCRVSTQVQDYERQVSDLTQFAKKHQWEIAETFTEKISGAKKNDERKELTIKNTNKKTTLNRFFLCTQYTAKK